MDPSSAGRLKKDVRIGLEIGLLRGSMGIGETSWSVKGNASGGPGGEGGGGLCSCLCIGSSSNDCPGACCWHTPTYGGGIARTPIDLLVVEGKIAKSVDSRLTTFGDSGVVCLRACLARKAETFDSRRRYQK
jgi:hypothetical protein